MLVTSLHDRYLSAEQLPGLSLTETSHWDQSISQFKWKMSGPIQPSERDALWVTSAVLATISFHTHATSPEEVWPLAPSSSLDLNWLKLSDGKRAVWKITNPLREDCALRMLAIEHSSVARIAFAAPGLERLPADLLILCGLDNMSNVGDNPYFTAVATLAQAWNTDCLQTIFLNFFCFITVLGPGYRELLERKEERALLLLAYWYAKVSQTHCWWAMRRAKLECKAICIYLDQYARQETLIQQLLQYPRTVFGIASPQPIRSSRPRYFGI